MARSLGLSAYLALARRESATLGAFTQERPSGELIWLHCADIERSSTLAQLGLRLASQRQGITILLTTSPDAPVPASLPDGIIWAQCPSENPSDIRKFLDYWSPDIGLWLGGLLRPALIDAAAKRATPLVLLDANDHSVENRRARLIPEPIKATLANFTSILAHSDEAKVRLRRLLVDGHKVQPSGPLLEDSPALTCNEHDLQDLSSSLGGRPVWLAAMLQPQELPAILNAHRSIVRLSHRMLLVLVPDTPEDAPAFKETCEAGGWRVGSWDDGQFPDANMQILLAENRRELGLMYRVSPVTFMGSSLVPGHGGRGPFEPAALGSAILYGPGVRRHLDSYSRLAKAGAARIVKDSDSLSSALSQLTAPDQVAAMAHAGWETVSEGAEVSDQIISLAQTLLDEKESQ
nr:glycosyltransferase N-terminal domain-containing protein [uncultured Shimia sp.]